MTSLEDSAMADWSDPPPCGCRDTAPACSRGRGLYALAVAAYVAWEWRHDAAARAWWRARMALTARMIAAALWVMPEGWPEGDAALRDAGDRATRPMLPPTPWEVRRRRN